MLEKLWFIFLERTALENFMYVTVISNRMFKINGTSIFFCPSTYKHIICPFKMYPIEVVVEWVFLARMKVGGWKSRGFSVVYLFQNVRDKWGRIDKTHLSAEFRETGVVYEQNINHLFDIYIARKHHQFTQRLPTFFIS